MKNIKNINTVKDYTGRDTIMVRTDKTIRDLMNAKPSSRWDVEYWNPKYEKYLIEVKEKYKIDKLGNFLTRCNQGDGLRSKKGDRYVQKGIPMISVVDINFTGINYSALKQIIESHYQRIASAKPSYGNILIVRSGAGSIGKSAIFLGNPKGEKIGITGHINTLGFKEINPFFVEVFLKTVFGQSQIERYENGVSGQTEFTQDSIAEIKIPIIPDLVQKNIESEYKKMSSYHEKAIDAKKIGDEAGYKRNIEIAEKMLKDLISKTEAVIRGERKDTI